MYSVLGDVVQELSMPQATDQYFKKTYVQYFKKTYVQYYKKTYVQYFKKTYVGLKLPGGTYQDPLFPIEMWNYHYDTAFGLPRTTNAVEAWHRSSNATVGCQYPNIWKFITALKRKQ